MPENCLHFSPAAAAVCHIFLPEHSVSSSSMTLLGVYLSERENSSFGSESKRKMS